ncbi:YgaP family membrane protein [Dyella acidisoli]|uniref:Inner membrane protein YgaP-like transmembrane domain-containing protein n=1 Tax=Dyella acidisoli TaxID=1867834 RepID=A0ABQ5XU20_9GAMM|nr:DUF2892 domain-containing protein [Dyella acidisoli]GLQ94448.1 hypothetical protein GCM10007901_34000 [Dyella acidisoli]
MSTIRAALYVKNVPTWERVVRIIVSAAIIAVGLVLLNQPWNWLVVASGAGFALSGIFGFCPACALAGRRLAKDS